MKNLFALFVVLACCVTAAGQAQSPSTRVTARYVYPLSAPPTSCPPNTIGVLNGVLYLGKDDGTCVNVSGSGGGLSTIPVQNQGTALSPQRGLVNLQLPFLKAEDDGVSATRFNSARTKTGVYNAITDLNMSGDPRLYQITANLNSGATSATLNGTTWELVNGAPDSSTQSIYALRYYANPQNTFRVGQGIRIPNCGTGGIDHVATITAVSGNTVTWTPATANAGNADFVTHDDTAALQNFLNTYSKGTIYFPAGFYPLSSYHNYAAGKDYAITLPTSVEAYNQQWVFEGEGRFLSGFTHSGPGHAIKLAGTSTLNLVWKNLYLAHVNRYGNTALSHTDAGAGLYLQSDQNAAGVPQSGATNVLIQGSMFLGWRYGILSDNLQSSKVKDTSFYFNANSIALIGSNNVRGIGSQTEPNVNVFDNLFIQYSVPLSGARRTGTGTTTTGANRTVTCTGGNFTAADLYKLVSIPTAGVNATTHYSIITAVNSATSITLSQPPWSSVSGVTLTVYPASNALFYAQNANNVTLRTSTFQGNWSSGTPSEQKGVFVENSFSLRIDGLWMEDTGGATTIPQGVGVHLNNVFSTQINGSSWGSNLPGGYAAALKLEGCTGVNIDSSHISQGGTAAGVLLAGTNRGIKVDNTTLPGSYAFYNVTNGEANSNYPGELGPGVRQFNAAADGANVATENLYDCFSCANLLTNGNFFHPQSMYGWTQVVPTAITHVIGAARRFERYVKIDYRTADPPDNGGTVLLQSYSIADSIESYTPLTLAFDWRIENRGLDAISSGSTNNHLRLKLLYSNGSSSQYEINPSLAFGLATSRWVRAQIQTLVPVGTGRAVQVLVETARGTNAGVFNLANFKLQLGKRVDYNHDVPILEAGGGTLYAPLTITEQSMPATPGAGSLSLFAQNAGNATRLFYKRSNGSMIEVGGLLLQPTLTPASVGANTTAEQDFTVAGLTTADKVFVNGPAPTAGTGIAGARVKADDTLSITFVNATGGALTPAAGVYHILAIR